MGTRHLVIVYYKGQYYIAQYGQWDGYPSGQGRDVLEFARDPELMAKLAAALDAGMVYEPAREELDELHRKVDDMKRMLEETQRKKAKAEEEAMNPELLEFFRDHDFMAWLTDGLNGEWEHEPSAEETEVVTIVKKALEEHKPPAHDVNNISVEQQAYNIVCPSISRDSGATILKIVAEATEPVPVENSLDFITDGILCEWAWVLDLDLRVLECWRGGLRKHEQSTRFDHLAAIQSGRGDRPKLMASVPLDNLPDSVLKSRPQAGSRPVPSPAEPSRTSGPRLGLRVS